MKRYHLTIALAATFASACSQSGPLPGPIAGASAHIEAANGSTPQAVEGTGTPCRHPQFPTICVRRGHSATLGIKITCTKGGKTVKCGTVTWSAKTSDERLTWSFSPNPGNPTTETIHAAKTIPLGKYSQSIDTTCSNVPDCPKDYAAPIYVVAK